MDESSFSLIANLAKTPAPDQNKTGDKVDFATAMQTLGYRSVFDILRSSKKSFVRQIRALSDTNAELAYDNAQCYATQIVRLYRNELISSGRQPRLTARTGVRSLVEIGPSYPNLFKENWDEFCKVGAIEAMDSPAAYLTSLYRFALRELEGATQDPNRIQLAVRRPDLASLMIDQQSTFKPVPMLDIVKSVLEKGIRDYTDREGSADKDKPVFELIAGKKHPFLFPYSYQHEQIRLGLSGKKPMLGEIDYRISLKLPIYGDGSNDYGRVKNSSSVAQCLMSKLSPEQQEIVTEASVFAEEDQENAYQHFYSTYYDCNYVPNAENNALTSLKTFLEKTGLTAEQTEALTAIGQYLPFKSPNAGTPPLSLPRPFGARYINKESDSESYSISISAGKLTHTTHKSFDRIQRMVRLQRWTGVPFAELDTLIVAAALAEIDDQGEMTNPDVVLNNNTLRALGVFNYFNKHFALSPEEFSATVHEIATFNVGERPSLFDRTFNNPQLFNTPLAIGNVNIYYNPTNEDWQKASAQVCAALHLEQSADSLGMLINDIYYFYNPLRDDGIRPYATPNTTLWSLSAFYRLNRIAHMFGLSVKDSRDLMLLLGGEDYLHTVVRGRIEPVPGADAKPDFLDVLMHMDWAVKWLKETGQDVTTLCARLAIDAVEPPVSQQLLDTLEQLATDARDTLLTAEGLAGLTLPATDSANAAIEWWPLLTTVIDENGLVIALPLTLENDSRGAIRSKVVTALETVDLGEAHDQAADQLTNFVFGGLSLQQRLIEGLLQSLSGLPMDRAAFVVRWADSDVQTLLSTVLNASDLSDLVLVTDVQTTPVVNAIRSVLVYSEVCQQLNLSAPALLTFLVNPTWLDPAFTAPLLPLSLASVYHLDRYSRWVNDCGAAEEQLTQYFVAANAASAEKAQCAATLAQLIDWPATDILSAAAFLYGTIAKSMSEVDWLRRVKGASEQTGLGATNLLKAACLDPANATRLDWQTVGEAAVASARGQ